MHQSQDPLSFVPHLRLGCLYLERERLDEAEAEFKEAINKNPRHAMLYYYLGRVYHKRKQWNRAVACYHKTLALNPELVEPHFHLALAYEQTGETEKALEEYGEAAALQVPGKSNLAERNLGRLSRGRRSPADSRPTPYAADRFDSTLKIGRAAAVFALSALSVIAAAALCEYLDFFSLLGADPEDRLSVSLALQSHLFSIFTYALVLSVIYVYLRRVPGAGRGTVGLRWRNFYAEAGYGLKLFLLIAAALGAVLLAAAGASYALRGITGLGPAAVFDSLRNLTVGNSTLLGDLEPSALTFLFVVFMAPLAEEIIFRGVLHSAIRTRLSAPPAILLSSALFAAFRFYAYGSLAGFVLGAACAFSYEKRTSIVPAVALHASWNAAGAIVSTIM
ncbi:MAG: CPBP family glutamic-type intramembrane protease [bacterium]